MTSGYHRRVGRRDAPEFPSVSWETLRDAYTARFGEPLRIEAEYDFGEPPPEADDGDESELRPPDSGSTPGSPLDVDESELRARIESLPPPPRDDDLDDKMLFWELTFASLTEADPRVVMASFGAAPRAGNEVFLASAVPFGGFAGVIKALIRDHAPLSPGMVIPMKIWSTPFQAVLLAPPGAGSIPLGRAGDVERFSLNVVPLTRAEMELAADSVDRLVAALRAAGALEATDPMRDCVLVPSATERYWAFVRPLLLEDTQDRLEQRSVRLGRLTGLGVPSFVLESDQRLVVQARLLLRHILSKKVDPGSPAERRAELFRRRTSSFEEISDHVSEVFQRGAVPAVLRLPCALIVAITTATHPVAQRLLLDVEGQPDRERFEVEELLPRLIRLIRESRPDADPAALLAGGRRGYALAQERAAVADGFVANHVAWEYVVAGMVTAMEDRATEEGAATVTAMRAGIDAANRVLLREGALPPMDRLKDASALIIVRIARTWCEALGLELPAPLTRRTSTIPPEGEGALPKKAKASKKGKPPRYH